MPTNRFEPQRAPIGALTLTAFTLQCALAPLAVAQVAPPATNAAPVAAPKLELPKLELKVRPLPGMTLRDRLTDLKKIDLGAPKPLTGAIRPDAAASGSGREGHGGRVWECQQPDGSVTYELLDFYHGRRNLGLTLDLPGATVEEKLETVLARIATVEPWRAAHYADRFARFMDRSRLTDEEFVNLGDTGTIFTRPRGCELKQVIHQIAWGQEDPRLPQVKFLITWPLWSQLDATQQAGLILHETVYEDATAQGHPRSDASMAMTAWLTSTDGATLSTAQWLERLTEWRMGYHLGRALVHPARLNLDPAQGWIRSAPLVATVDPEFNRVLIPGKLDLRFVTCTDFSNCSAAPRESRGNLFLRKLDPSGFFDASGGLRSAAVAIQVFEEDRGIPNVRLDGIEVIAAGYLDLHPNGVPARIQHAVVPVREAVWIPVDGSKAWLLSFGTIGFDEAGRLREFKTQVPFEIERNGQRLKIAEDRTVVVDADRRIRAAYLAKPTKVRRRAGGERRHYPRIPLIFGPDLYPLEDGVYSSLLDETGYVAIREIAPGRLAFAQCDRYDQPIDRCHPLGSTAGYPVATLAKQLKSGLRLPKRGSRENANLLADRMNFNFMLGAPILGAGTTLIPALAASPIAPWVIGAMFLGAAKTWSWPARALFGTRDAARARTAIARERYLLIDRRIDDVARDLEAALLRLPPEKTPQP